MADRAEKPRLTFKSIRTRFTLWCIGSFIVLPLIAWPLSGAIARWVSLRGFDRTLQNDAQHLATALQPCWPTSDSAGSGALAECLDQKLRTLFPRQVAYAQLSEPPRATESAGRVLATSYAMLSLRFELSPEARAAMGQGEPYFESIGPYQRSYFNRVVTLRVRGGARPPYVLQLGLDLFQETAARPHFFLPMVLPLVLGATAWGYYFMRRVFAPVHTIVGLARRISAEDLSLRIDGVESNDEIGELVETLNGMMARLERSFRQMEQFSSDVAHELRTPLTIIKGEVEVALKRERTEEEYRTVLASLLEEAERLGEVIEDLLLLARIEAQQDAPRFGSVELDAALLEAYEEAASLARGKTVAVRLQPIDDVRVIGDAGLLKRLFANLLRNAVSYTPAGGRIEVSLTVTADEASVEIADTGCGIPAEALPYVFDRFYRVDQSRSHETGGAGLGLAIVQKIADAHQARIDVQSRVGQGTVFRIAFRRA